MLKNLNSSSPLEMIRVSVNYMIIGNWQGVVKSESVGSLDPPSECSGFESTLLQQVSREQLLPVCVSRQKESRGVVTSSGHLKAKDRGRYVVYQVYTSDQLQLFSDRSKTFFLHHVWRCYCYNWLGFGSTLL